MLSAIYNYITVFNMWCCIFTTN